MLPGMGAAFVSGLGAIGVGGRNLRDVVVLPR